MSDLDALLAIERTSFGADAYDRKLFAELFAACGRLFLVAAAGARIRAYIVTETAVRREALCADVVSLAVGPAWRGRGIARALLGGTLRRLQLRRVERVTLTVRASNGPARALYARFGFTRLRRVRGYYEDGEDALVLLKRL